MGLICCTSFILFLILVGENIDKIKKMESLKNCIAFCAGVLAFLDKHIKSKITKNKYMKANTRDYNQNEITKIDKSCY